MPESILRVGAEFDVSSLVAGAAEASVSVDKLGASFQAVAARAEASGQTLVAQAARFQAAGLSATEAASALVFFGSSEVDAAVSATALSTVAALQSVALTNVAKAATTASTGTSGFERAAAGATGRLLGMEAGAGMAGGALGRLAGFLPGMGVLFEVALPVALISFAVERMEAFRDSVEKASQAAMDFGIESYKNADAIGLENIKLEGQIETLEGVPKTTGLSEALMQSKITAEELGKTLEGDIQKSIELLNVGSLSQFFTKASGDEEQFKDKLQEITDKIQTARLALAQAPPGSAEGKAAIQAQIDGYKEFGAQIDADIIRLQAAGGVMTATGEVFNKSASIAKLNELKIGAQEATVSLGELSTHANLSNDVAGVEAYNDRLKRTNETLDAQRKLQDELKGAHPYNLSDMMSKSAPDPSHMFGEAMEKDSIKAMAAVQTLMRASEQDALAQARFDDIKIKGAEELTLATLATDERRAEGELSIDKGIIAASTASAAAKARAVNAAEVAELNQLKAIAAEKLKVVIDEANAEQKALGERAPLLAAGTIKPDSKEDQDSAAKYQQLEAQKAQANQKFTDTVLQDDQRIALSNQQATNAMTLQWNKAMTTMNQQFQTNFDQVIRGTETVKFAFIKMGGDILISIVHSFEQAALKAIESQLQITIAHAISQQIQTAATVAGTAERKTVEASASATSILKSAEKGAAAVYSAAVDAYPAPLGQIIGAAEAVGVFAAIMAFGSAEKGAVVSHDMMIAAHANEMVLPAHISQPLQAAIPNIGRFNDAVSSGGGLAPGFAGSGAGGGSGRSSGPSGPTYNTHISALDPQSMASALGRNKATVMGLVRNAVRNGARVR